MSKSIILFFISALAFQPGGAQPSSAVIEGQVVAEDNQPLPAASIALEELSKGTSTDASGTFKIYNLKPGRYTLTVSMIGYKTYRETVSLSEGETAKLNITLLTESYSLGDDVVITATRTEQAVATAPASISVVSAQLLEQQPVADLTDALRNIPGVNLSASSQGRKTIQLRGMESSHTLLLIDGRRVNSSEAVFRHNDYDLSMLPIDAVDRIEVVRGGMSALYGSEALGGVINVITKPVSSQWDAKISSEFQTPTTGEGGEEYRTSIYSTGSLVKDKLGLTLSGTFNHRNIWNGWPDEPLTETDGSPVTRPDGSEVNRDELATLEGRNDHNFRSKFTWTPARNQTIEAEYGRGYQTRTGEYFIRGWGEADTEINRNDVVLSHRSNFSGGASELRGYREWIDSSNDGLSQANTTIEGNINLNPAENNALTIGGEARWMNLDAPAEFESGSAGAYQQAVYLQNEYTLNSRFKLLAGARLDNHENFGLHLTPRGYLVFSATDQLIFKGGVGTAFKAPTLRQLSNESKTTSCRGGCVIVGDPDLNPEISTNFELSANYKSSTWGGSVTAFQNNVDNLIDTPRGDGVPSVGTDPESGLDMYVPRNVNEARIRGIETTLFANLGNKARITANYAHLDAKDLTNNEDLQNRPRHNVNSQLNWYINNKATVFLRGKYIGEQITTAGAIDPYSMIDFGGSYHIMDTLRIRAGVTNLANTRTDNPNDGYSFVERARTIYVGFSAEL